MPHGIAEPRRPRWLLLVGIAAVVAVGVALFGLWAFRSANKNPSFPSLADAPDPSFHGTVAYLDWKRDTCLRVVAMSGAWAKTVSCLKGVNGSVPELTWLAGGRVQLTQYGDWRKIVDVQTGAVEDVPATEVPKTGQGIKPVTISPDGQKLVTTNMSGHVQVTLEDSSGTRVLLDARGGNLYELGTANWSPDYTFILTTDSAARLLVTTIGTAPTTRVLATELGGSWAATSQEIPST